MTRMHLELSSASNFLVHLLRLARKNTIHEAKLEKFGAALKEVLRRRYRDHWFEDKPYKGSGYRCIRINGNMDPVLAQAAEVCAVCPQELHRTFPSELTMWIDPREVSYRIGENGSICVLYEREEGVSDPWTPKKFEKSPEVKKEVKARPCGKESLRNIDYLLDPRQSVSIEQLTAYVSS